MVKELLISSSPYETKVAILEEDQLAEVYFEQSHEYSIAGSIYKGRVTRVLPGMQSAFVDIGLERDAFLYVSDFLEDAEVFDKIDTGVGDSLARISERAPSPASRPLGAPQPPEPISAPQASVPEPEATTGPGGAAQGRRRRGRRRARRRFGGRGFPQAKYAGPSEAGPQQRASSQQGADSQQGASSQQGESSSPSPIASRRPAPMVLPGESLAKYRQLIPAASDGPAFHEPAVEEIEKPQETDNTAEPFGSSQPEPQSEEARQEEASSPETDTWSAPAVVPETGEPEAAQFEQVPGAPPASGSVSEAILEPTPSEESVEQLQMEEPAPAAGEEAPEESVPQTLEDVSSLAVTEEDAEAAIVGGDQAGDPEQTPAGESSVAGVEGAPAGEPAGGRVSASGPRFDRRVNRRLRRKMQSDGRQQPRPQAPADRSVRSQPLITDLLREGQEILVQVAKEPLGRKGARITSHIALPGRYLVYMPTLEHVGVSRRVTTEEERQRLKRVILEAKSEIPGGFIVRTAGEGRSEKELLEDVQFLHNLWLEIRAKAERTAAPALLHHDLNLVERILRDQLSEEFRALWVDNEQEYETILKFVQNLQPVLVSRVKLYTKDAPLFEEFNVYEEINKALKPMVWLKSGGYIVINHTEALVSIDINTGKYVGKTPRLEDTIVKTNVEAIREIVHQIRLRDLGGIIVIDFIDMEERRNRTRVMQALEEALRQDRAPSKVVAFNEFGLVAITRKRVKQSLEHTLCAPCVHCSGSGFLKSPHTIAMEILTEASKLVPFPHRKQITLRVSPEVARYLKQRDVPVMQGIEDMTHQTVFIKTDPTLHPESFDFN